MTEKEIVENLPELIKLIEANVIMQVITLSGIIIYLGRIYFVSRIELLSIKDKKAGVTQRQILNLNSIHDKRKDFDSVIREVGKEFQKIDNIKGKSKKKSQTLSLIDNYCSNTLYEFRKYMQLYEIVHNGQKDFMVDFIKYEIIGMIDIAINLNEYYYKLANNKELEEYHSMGYYSEHNMHYYHRFINRYARGLRNRRIKIDYNDRLQKLYSKPVNIIKQ